MAQPYLGQIHMFAGNFPPLGYQLCHGQSLSIGQYQALFSIIGTTYGGDGVNTFALPDMRGRLPVHSGNSQGPGLSPRVLGQTAGTETVMISLAQMPSNHTHAVTLNVSAGPANTVNPASAVMAVADEGRYAAAVTPNATLAVSSMTLGANTGGSQPYDTRQPLLCINFIIAVEGIFPSRN
jgi:microcystin-dependent protein